MLNSKGIKMNYLLLGDLQSVHILNFVKVLKEVNKDANITIFDLGNSQYKNDEASQFYAENQIKTISDNQFKVIMQNNIFNKVPKVKTLIYIKKLQKKLLRLGEFDYCFVHFVDNLKVRMVEDNPKLKNIIPVFWGSDLLRNNLNKPHFIRFFKRAKKIVFNTENMKGKFLETFKASDTSKLHVVKFPIKSFEIIDNILTTTSKRELRNKLNLPSNQLITICGHAGSRAENHLEMIKNLKLLDTSAKEQMLFIFPMTYGESDLEAYTHEVKTYLENETDLNFLILSNYLDNRSMIEYMVVADLFINCIKSDAFSATMQENLYSGSFVIHGDWLNYVEFEKHEIFTMKLSSINELPDVLSNLSIQNDKEAIQSNKEKIKKISSFESITKNWKEIIK
jgi:hypothetical protein